MRLSHVDLNLFVVFEAIYTERNLTRAAEVLHITQPAASNALLNVSPPACASSILPSLKAM